jgi:tRNA pseudouridine38-40 synthase
VLGYDGTDFAGYQIQARGRTVQGELEQALARIARAPIRPQCAGRTDAGVHATGQVVAFDLAWRHEPAELQRALNALLPPDMLISDLQPAVAGFSPRFDAVSRTYHYRLLNRPWPDLFQRRYAYHVRQPLDLAAMNEAAQALRGWHDFASFGKPPQGDNTVRQVMVARWSAGENGLLTFEVTANAFLYHMARIMVGTLVQIGWGHRSPTAIPELLAARNLRCAAPPAPAHGLCLVKVTYPADQIEGSAPK